MLRANRLFDTDAVVLARAARTRFSAASQRRRYASGEI